MSMKDPSTVQTTSRDEMICPACHTEGLEEHEAFSDDYSGKAEILKATRCPNPDCKYYQGFPPEVLTDQYHDPSLLKKIASSENSGGPNLGSIIIYGIVIIGIIFMGASAMGVDIASMIGGDSGQSNINGYVVGPDGEPVEGATVELDGAEITTTTNENGTFILENVSHGQHTVVARPESGTGVVEQGIVLSDEGLEAFQGTTMFTTINTSSEQLGLQLVNVKETKSTRMLSSGQNITYSFASPKNLGDGLQVTLMPINTSENYATQDVSMGNSTVNVPEGAVLSGNISVTGTVSTSEFENSYTYRGEPQDVRVYGNLEPQEVVVDLSDEAGTPTYTKEENVSDGETVTVDVSGDGTVGGVEVVLSGGQSSAPNTQEGTYTGENPSVAIDAESAPSTVDVTLTGQVSQSSQSTAGTITGNTLAVDFAGNIPATNATITFTGGEPVNSTVSNQSVEASGDGGTTTKQRVLTDNAREGTYELQLDHTILQNSSLVRAGYNIDGVRHEISAGDETVEINATGGETIAIWIEAQQEEMSTADYTHSGQFEVKNVELQKKQMEPGQDTGVRATFSNPSSSSRTETVRLFKDGDQIQSKRVTIGANGEQTITFNRVSFSSEGIHSIEVNDADPVKIQVGDAELAYGSGRIQGKLVETGDGGEILFDTTGDDSFDCQVSADGGTCDIGQVPSGTQSFDMTQRGVKNTSYSISYTSRTGAQGITVDIGNDGTDDITHPGVLEDGETVTGSVTLEAGTHEIDFNVENGGELPYELQWTEAGVVNQPTVSVNGETVINEDESFKGERSYEINNLPNGENTFTFQSGSGNAYIAEIIWSEQSSETTPRLVIDGETACSKDEFAGGSCTVPTNLLDSGSNTFAFEGGASEFSYTVTQTARATPSRITATINGQEMTLTRDEAVSTSSSGSWTAEQRVTNVQSGENTVVLSTSQVNGMETSATGEVGFAYEASQARNPSIVVYNGTAENIVEVSADSLDSEGYLQTNATATIPARVFTHSENNITVRSANNGTVRIAIVSVNETVSSPIGEDENESSSNETTSNTTENKLADEIVIEG